MSGQERKAAPLLITAELPGDMLAWADGLRRVYYPPERNRLKAHVTLFHALPPSAEGEVRGLLAELASDNPPPEARTTGIFDLGTGTAIDVRSEALEALHAGMAECFHGLLGWQDDRRLRLHITVQNKVDRATARALQTQLERAFAPRRFRFKGFGLYAWEDGLWREIVEYSFRG